MTLREIMERHVELFYFPGDPWFTDQPFMDEDVVPRMRLPDAFVPSPLGDPATAGFLPFAATLAYLYTQHPHNPMWERFHWCADKDRSGMRVYVGGVGYADIPRFQIHRALPYHDNPTWGVPVWTH